MDPWNRGYRDVSNKGSGSAALPRVLYVQRRRAVTLQGQENAGKTGQFQSLAIDTDSFDMDPGIQGSRGGRSLLPQRRAQPRLGVASLVGLALAVVHQHPQIVLICRRQPHPAPGRGR